MAAPTLDGVANAVITASNTGTVTLTTTHTNDVIVVAIGSNDVAGTTTVSSVTAAGLTFAHRSSNTVTVSGNNYNSEVWWAPSTSTLTGKVITVNMSGTTAGVAINAFGVNGANNINTPFDSNTGLPKLASSTTGNPSTTVSTSQANDFIFVSETLSSNDTGTSISGFSNITQRFNFAGGTGTVCELTDYKGVTTVQTGLSVPVRTLGSGKGTMIVDAITADSAATTGTIAQAFGKALQAIAGLVSIHGPIVQAFGGISQAIVGNEFGNAGSIAQAFRGISQTIAGLVSIHGPIVQAFGGISQAAVGIEYHNLGTIAQAFKKASQVAGGNLPNAPGTGKAYSYWTTKT